MNIAEVVKQKRWEQRLTLRKLEKLTGISNAYLSQLENGRIKKPSWHAVAALALVLDFSLDELASYVGIPLHK